MSTNTQTAAPDFVAAAVRKMPTIACTGYIDEISEVKDTEKGVYAIFNVNLVGTRGSRGARLNFLFRPEWFDVGFNPATMEAYETEEDPKAGSKMLSVYRRYIAPASGLSVLKGLSGSDENFGVFLQRRAAAASEIAASRPDEPTFNEQDVHSLLTNFWTEDCAGTEVGYILKQGREKSDMVDENGRVIYLPTERYEVDGWFFPHNERDLKSLVNRAKRSRDGSFIIGFEME